jgi:hypothetical protein
MELGVTAIILVIAALGIATAYVVAGPTLRKQLHRDTSA